MTAGHAHHEHAPDAAEPPDADVIAALKALLIEKGYFTAEDVRAEIEKLQAPGPHQGAALVARAWLDPGFRARLLADGKAAAAEVGFVVGEAQLMVVENTPDAHNLVTCTLCSCYPRSLLGQPPAWYASKAYRARSVRDPRGVLAELGWTPPPGVRLRVHDSTADLRYLVLPMRPAGTEDWSEAALATLVSRDAMIGVAPALDPSRAP